MDDYCLKKIPFKSLATDTGQYEHVLSRPFNELTEEIAKIRASDPAAIIIQGPQGSGKTATKNGIKNKFQTEKNVAIIHVNLLNLKMSSLTFSIIDNAQEEKFIDDAFLQKINYSNTDLEKYTNPDLIKKIIQTIEEVLKEKDFGILIIDEMDILAQPTYYETPEQSEFVHAMQDILNKLAESKIVQTKSFCTILANTDKSSQDFRDIMKKAHKPFGSRVRKMIDIKYDIEETKEIVRSRLKAEGIPGKEKTR